MLVYLACYILSVFIIHVGLISKPKPIARFIIFIGLFLPAILAGCRDFTIGTDILEYGNRIFNSAASADSFIIFIGDSYNKRSGIFYLLLNYFIASMTDNAHWFYFTLSFITTGIVFITLIKRCAKKYIWIGMLSYYLLFYQESYNILRQYVAIVIVFYAVNYLYSKKYIKYCGFIVVGMLFHSSAIIGFLLIFTYLSIYGNYPKYVRILFITVLFVGLFVLNYIVNMLISIGILPSNYYYYVTGTVKFVFLTIPLCIPIFILCYINRKHLKKINQKELFFLLFNCILEAILLQLTSIFEQGIRISRYFGFFRIEVQQKNIECTSNIRRHLSIAFIIFYDLAYWYYYFIYSGAAATFPYTSSILGI